MWGESLKSAPAVVSSPGRRAMFRAVKELRKKKEQALRGVSQGPHRSGKSFFSFLWGRLIYVIRKASVMTSPGFFMKNICFVLFFLFGFLGPSFVAPWEAHATAYASGKGKAGADWEERYVKEARITIEKGVIGVMSGLHSPEQLRESVDSLCRTWSSWEDSRLFILQDDRDIDVYGNLYSLRVLCRTLRLAAGDWHAAEQSARSESTLQKALWLEKESNLLASPVAEIIRHQSYSDYLPRRVEIMQEQFPYVDEFYNLHSFRSVLR